MTNARALTDLLSPEEAWGFVDEWLGAPSVWIPQAGPKHRDILGRLIGTLQLRSNLVPDGVLAALCVEHGLTIVSADSDFARFGEIAWLNPLA